MYLNEMRQDNLPEGIRVEEGTLQVDTLREGIHVAEDTLQEDTPVVDILPVDIPPEDIQLEDSRGEDMVVQKGKLHDEGNVLLQQHMQQD